MSTERLYGQDGAEELYSDLGDAYESDIEQCAPDPDPCECESHEILEWTVHPPRYHLQTAESILVRVVGDLDEWTESDDWSEAIEQPDVLAAMDAVLDLMASKVTYRMADRLVATHQITWDAKGEPLVNGEPMYLTVPL